MPGDTPMPFDPEYDAPLFYCCVCARELRRPWCRKCGTEDNTASNWIPNGKKQRPAAPLAFDAALAALDVEVNINAHRQVTTYDILGLDAVRAAHRAEVERAVAEERNRNLDVLADFYSKTRAGRYASLSKEARQARLDVLTHAYSRMGGGLIHERADELDRDEPIDGEAIRARGTKS